MSEMHYHESVGLKIVPQYDGARPVGFSVVRVATGEVLEVFKMLWEAEHYISQAKVSE